MARTAEEPGQALNIDLCFVPEQHEPATKLPAVSGSSGHLVIERTSSEPVPSWPGQVFAQADLTFPEAMQQYWEDTQDRQVATHTARSVQVTEPTPWRQEWEGRRQRYQELQRRKQEDAEWQAAKERHRQARLAHQQLPKTQRKQEEESWQLQQAAWNTYRQQRREQVAQRAQENQAWHARIRQMKAGEASPVPARSWIAVLVVTDNCTRRCLGLPIFRSGAKVTSQEVVEALRPYLPAQLQYLISDQGKHFRSKWMDQLAQAEDFVQVLIYRHRPQSNGIAERFVLTLKQWLMKCAWQSADEVELLLKHFQPEYNDRPHQGLGIPGLSPNEFANRIWLM